MDSESNQIRLEHSYAFIADILKWIKVEGDDIEIKYKVLGEADANQTNEYSDVYVSNVAQKFKGYSHANNTTLLSEVRNEECECNDQTNHLELEDNCDEVGKINPLVSTNDDSFDKDAKESHQDDKKKRTDEICRVCFKMCCNCKTMNGESKRIQREYTYVSLKRTQVEEDDVLKYEIHGEADAFQCDKYFDLDASSVGQRFKSYLHSNNTTLLSVVSDDDENHLEDNCNLVNKINLSVAANTELVDMDSTEILECHQNYERMKTEARICRFCFTICCNFKTIDGDIKEVSNVVLPGIDLAAIQEPVMCTVCEEILFTSFDFKARCLYTHNYLIQFANKKDGVKLNLKDIYMNKNKNSISMLGNGDVCVFCMCPVENCSAKFLDVGERDVMLRNTLGHCLPELDLSIIEKPVICAPCHSSLKKHFRFVSDILIIEEKIRKYKGTLDVTSNGGDIIKLEIICDSGASVDKGVENECTGFVDMDDLKFKNEREFTPTNMLADEIEGNKIVAIKIKEKFCGVDGTKFKEENVVKVEDQKILLDEIEIKTDELDFNCFEDSIHMTQLNARTNGEQDCSVLPDFMDNLLEPHIEQTCTKKNVPKRKQRFTLKRHVLNHKHPSEETMHKCDSCAYQTILKGNLKRHLLKHTDISEVTSYKCDLCLYQTKHKSLLKRHFLKHKHPSEVTMHKCDSCAYQTIYKSALKSHLLKHKDISEVTVYKCDLCMYQTKNESLLKIHLLKHKHPSEVAMHKCDSCAYQTIRKGNLKTHLLNHKDISEVTVYTCDLCMYQTKNKSNLKIHFLKHKHPSEVTMHKCDSCTYQTIYKSALKSHLLKHKDISEVTVYKCDLCMYQTKNESMLKIHFLKHTHPSEVTMHKCDSCAYQTIRKDNLKMHLLNHKDISEVTMYKCDLCIYQTKNKSNLKIHFLKHKDPSEVTMHKCDSCAYQTILKGNLKTHLLNHKDISEVTEYKCDLCMYRTNKKAMLKTHFLKHKHHSEVTMHKCDSCAYQTIYKSALKSHFLKHKDISEVTVYKCDLCMYKTKKKSNLKIHFLKHKQPSEVTMLKCDSCAYQTIYKNALKTHLLKHKDISEVTVYKCDLCLYQTKYKSKLKRHSLKHKHPSEVTMHKCDLCTYQSKRKCNLKTHLLKHKDISYETKV